MNSKQSPLRLVRLMMEFNGMIPNPKRKNLFPIVSILNTTCISLFCIVAGMHILTIDCIQEGGFEAFQFLFAGTHLLTKQLNFIVKKDEVLKLFGEIENLWVEQLEDEEAKEIINYHGRRIEKMMKIIIYLFIPLVPFQVVVTLMSNWYTGQNTRLLEMWVIPIFNYSRLLRDTSQIVIFSSGVFIDASCVMFFRGVSEVICTFLIILQKRVVTIHSSQRKSCFAFHQKIIRLVSCLNTMHSFQAAFEIAITSILSCCRAYLLHSSFERIDFKGTIDFYILLLCLLPPYLICSNGSMISKEGQNVYRCTYMNMWYEEKSTTNKDLLIMNTMAIKGLSLHYRHLIKFDMERFTKVLQATFSYIAIVRSLNL